MITLLWGLIGMLGALPSTTMASSKEQVVFGSDSQDSLVRQGNLPTLADLLTLETRASIFYSYAREVDTSQRFSNHEDALTMFVPTNKAVMALGRKPHEDPDDSNVFSASADYEAISRTNVRRWVGAHIVPVPDVNFTSDKPYVTLTTGVVLSFKPISHAHHPSGEPVIDDDSAHFASIKGPVKNTDAAHLASVKGHSSSGTSPQLIDKPVWRNYVINHNIHIIDKKEASNGMLYLIDGAVNV